jgi:thiol-disulfide isomerase/thioredoxin
MFSQGLGRALAAGTAVLVMSIILLSLGVNGRSQAQDATATPTVPPTATLEPKRADLPDLGEAPELTNSIWLNVDAPLRLEELKGKVVLINFWTFGCINCRNVLPYVKQWHETYGEEGLVVIGVHYPEFSYEANLDNLRDAVERLGVTWAVAEDNDGSTWKAYQNRFWPTMYLIDKEGQLRYKHIGEGAYTQTETAIRDLLNEPAPAMMAEVPAWQKLSFTDAATNQVRSFSEFAGKTIVVETFATWCPNCRAQLAEVAKIAGEFEAQGIVYIALGIDPNESVDAIGGFAKSSGYNWVFGISSPELTTALIEQFGRAVTVPPSVPMFIIRADATTSELFTGRHSADELKAIIDGQRK